jgi:hypothetical protein
MKNPKQQIEAMIETHGYKGISINKDKDGLFSIKCINNIPVILWQYINENYNVTHWSRNYIEFYEFQSFGTEVYFNEFM